MKDVRVVTPKLPEPLLVSHGKFKAPPSTILLEGHRYGCVGLQAVRSDVTTQGYRHGLKSVLADFSGTCKAEK